MRFRLNLPELEDQPWLPDVIRRGMLDALRFGIEITRIYAPTVPLLAAALRRTGAAQVVDLCSGSGGGLPQVQRGLSETMGREVRVVLTDLYPNLPAYQLLARESGGSIGFWPEAVNATAVPVTLAGFRTVYSAFHHFTPEQGCQLLRNAVASGEGIAVFEGAGKHWWEVVALWAWLPLLWVVTPFLKPFCWSRLLWTYGLPLIPLGTIWDGTASILRLYSVARLRQLAAQADPEKQYDWQCDTVSAGFGRSVTYLIGTPQSEVPSTL